MPLSFIYLFLLQTHNYNTLHLQFITFSFNLLTPKSDQHQICPCNINALSNRVVMRIMDMITQDEFV